MAEGIHEPIVSRITWHEVQDRMAGKSKRAVQIVSDDMPLRSILKRHCGLPLTGAPSRSRNGNYYNYYKCKLSGHNNISALKAHEQLLKML